MKVKVLIPFCDKNTGKTHKQNDIIEVDVKRFNEINKDTKHIQPVEETTTAKV